MSAAETAAEELSAFHVPHRGRVTTAFWTLSDQAIVSIGAFTVNIALARHLPTSEYGTYGLLWGGLVTLQMALGSLVFHPLSIKRSVSTGRARCQLAWASLVMTAIICIPLAAILCVVLLLTRRGDLVASALAFFLAWQMQETVRRNLLSDLRFQAAALGDGTAYLGQAGLAVAFGLSGHLTLPVLLWSGAGLYLLAAAIQLTQLSPAIGPVGLRAIGRDFCASGAWSLFSNAVSAVRIQSAPWMLAWFFGPAAVALLQASISLVNLSNPIMMALCNVIPPTAARAGRQGPRAAWRAARFYMLIGSPLIALLLGVVMALPDLALLIVYGANSPYLGLGDQVRILVVAAVLGFATEMVCSYFHGIDRAQIAFTANAAGAVACLPAVPLIWTYGVTGACLSIAAVQAIRLIVAYILLTKELAADVERDA